MGLAHTTFVEARGIETGNQSTAREMGRLAFELLKNDTLRHYTATVSKTIHATNGYERRLMNSNWMLWKPQFDDVYVMGGKTG